MHCFKTKRQNKTRQNTYPNFSKLNTPLRICDDRKEVRLLLLVIIKCAEMGSDNSYSLKRTIQSQTKNFEGCTFSIECTYLSKPTTYSMLRHHAGVPKQWKISSQHIHSHHTLQQISNQWGTSLIKGELSYHDLVIVLPSAVNYFPQNVQNIRLAQNSAKANSQVTVHYPPVQDL